ncbi:MAG: ABC transporter ATP-binding protein [Clostridia bacterium]|nr:ABC transporter ATP-binding protein [Clostridia bacterium]
MSELKHEQSAASAIETTDLTRCFGDLTAVDHLNLTVNQGELFALLGVNGAGKTTLIRILSGLLAPTSGDALVMGKSILREPAAVKAVIGVSPQETAVGARLTVRENLSLICGVYGYDKHERTEKTEAMLRRLKLTEVADKRAQTLSGGWMRRLSIAMALISEPKVLFLDEPTLGLDVLIRRELWQIIRELKGATTIVLTTHYLEEAEALSDRIGIMAHGHLKALGTAEELKQRTGVQNFEDAFIQLAGEEMVS